MGIKWCENTDFLPSLTLLLSERPKLHTILAFLSAIGLKMLICLFSCQLDLEMSFVTRDRVMSLIEKLLKHSWPEDVSPITTPFPHMTYEQAMRLYGTDKPDTRFDMQVS